MDGDVLGFLGGDRRLGVDGVEGGGRVTRDMNEDEMADHWVGDEYQT